MGDKQNLNSRVELGEGEIIFKESKASLQTGFLIPQPGRLILTSQRLMFLSARVTIPFPAQKLQSIVLDLADIKAVEISKGDITNLLAGSFRKRLHVQDKEKSYIFQVRELDEWIDQLKKATTGAG